MHYIFVILLILSLPLKSQNLVRNPSFEKHERIPCSKGTGVEQGKMQQYVYDWSIPVYGSPNVYHQEGLKICPETYRQHKTILVPKDGKMMIGVYAHKDNWGELIQTKLKLVCYDLTLML